eukprot:scaffold1146_cov399-Prasinococcus_capsulatus_cf.AAC.68
MGRGGSAPRGRGQAKGPRAGEAEVPRLRVAVAAPGWRRVSSARRSAQGRVPRQRILELWGTRSASSPTIGA